MSESRIPGMAGYTLLRELGRGGMAIVYLAEQQSLGREVALKVMSPGSDQDPTLAERFMREARIAANLHHPHIVAIHDFGVRDGSLFIAMEYEPGGSVLPPHGECLDPRVALRIVRDIADALDYAHGLGVVHRDIKPDNILRRSNGSAMLSDFGIARMMHGESVLTVEGTSVGTPHYMSPEQLRGEKVDGRSDIYSLGVVLWQLLTGQLPYSGADNWAIGTQHISADIPRLPSSQATLQGLIDAMMAKRAEDRPQSGAEVVQRVDALLASKSTPPGSPAFADIPGLPASATPATVPASPSQPGEHRSNRGFRSRGVLLVLVVGALLLGLLGWRKFGAELLAGDAPSTAAPAPPASALPRSIAVMAFKDLSENHDQSYFSDGISEELLNRLAQVAGLQVAGRSSSMSFKDKNATIAEIGKTLGVDSVLEGSVRMDGDRLRVTVQLNNVADGFQIWSQSYDRKLTDIFAVQEEIASAVVESLKLKLLTGGTGRRHTPSFEVYAHYLRGRQALVRSDMEAGLQAYRQAVALDPEYAQAFAGLAMAESFMARRSDGPVAYAEAKRRAMAAAERAVQLDPTLGDAYGARGYLRGRELDWAGALADTEKSLSLDPGEGRNHLRRGTLLAALNRLEEARAVLEQGLAVDPLLTPSWYWLFRIKAVQGDFVGARQAYDRVLAIDPEYLVGSADLGMLDLLQGDAAGARRRFLESDAKILVPLADHDLGRPEQARAALDSLAEGEGRRNPYAMAVGYAWIGEKSEAFQWLDLAFEEKSYGMFLVSFDPMLRSLRGDPRMALLLKKLGLPEQRK